MVLFLHGVAGGWDELLIAIVAFGVLWVAVKLAGRKSADDDEDEELDEEELAEREVNVRAAHSGQRASGTAGQGNDVAPGGSDGNGRPQQAPTQEGGINSGASASR